MQVRAETLTAGHKTECHDPSAMPCHDLDATSYFSAAALADGTDSRPPNRAV